MGEVLNDWLKEVRSHAFMTPTQEAKITLAGARVFKNELQKATKAKHYSNKKNEKRGHMADNITVQGTNIDGIKNGVATVGWNNKYHAANARRLNDGTKKYRADHFVENVRNDEAVIQKVLEAEQKTYKKVLKENAT